jgi:hypothetical protein
MQFYSQIALVMANNTEIMKQKTHTLRAIHKIV